MTGSCRRFAREPQRPQANGLLALRVLRVLVFSHRKRGVGFEPLQILETRFRAYAGDFGF